MQSAALSRQQQEQEALECHTLTLSCAVITVFAFDASTLKAEYSANFSRCSSSRGEVTLVVFAAGAWGLVVVV
jgi:hypothetical protein